MIQSDKLMAWLDVPSNSLVRPPARPACPAGYVFCFCSLLIFLLSGATSR